MSVHRSGSTVAAFGALALGLAASGCAHRAASVASAGPAADSAPSTAAVVAPASRGGFLSMGRGPRARTGANASPTAIGVNAYLWRASLDTLAFMPLASADPYGGIIITDWYANPQVPSERFKATVYILDTRLRADGLNVTVFKQTKDAAGQWIDAPVAGQTDIDIENAILTKARQLRLSNIGRG